MKKVFGYSSFELKTKEVEMYITEEGGHMAPVKFFPESENPVSPYYVNPWNAESRNENLPVLLQALRGDFLCLPMGGNNKTEDFDYPPHGWTANGNWTLKEKKDNELIIETTFPDKKAHVEGRFSVKEGESNLYIEHIVSNCNITLPYGHHCILDSNAPLLISTSPVKFGIVTQESDTVFSDLEYRALLGHKVFKSLEEAPSRFVDIPSFDASVFPAREGFVDIVQMVNDPNYGPIGWSVAVCPSKGYLWFALKKVSDFPSTLFWMENKGRYGEPWRGRNVCIGVEDVMSCFAAGAAVSCVDNELTRLGIKTAREFKGGESLRIIEGVARVPSDFKKVSEIKFDKNLITFVDEKAKEVTTSVDLSFLS